MPSFSCVQTTLLLLASLSVTVDSFAPGANKLTFAPTSALTSPSKTTRLHLFGRKGKDDKVEEDDEDGGKEKVPFFAFLRSKKEEEELKADDAVRPEEPKAAVVEQEEPASAAPEVVAKHPAPEPVVVGPPAPEPAAVEPPVPEPVAVEPPVPEPVAATPVDKVAALRAQANRARLEAQQMDAELTRSKITKLEKQMTSARKKGESTEELMQQMDNLQKKLAGEPTTPIAAPAPATAPREAAPRPARAAVPQPAPVAPKPVPVASTPVADKSESVSKVAALKAQAERVRLEAEKMDAELTLGKIIKLEKQVAAAQKKGDSTADLMEQMDNLQRKMRGEAPKAVVVPAPAEKKTTSSPAPATIEIAPGISLGPMLSPPEEPLAPFSQVEFDRTLEEFKLYPSYMKVLLARSVGMQPMNVREINATEYALRSEKQQRLDFSFLGEITAPEFTQQEIDEYKKSFSLVDWRAKLPDTLDIEDLTEDEFVLKAMQEEYYFKQATKEYGISKGMAEGFLAGNSDDMDKFTSMLEDEMNRSQPYLTMQNLFPECVEKEGEVPTEAQVKMLISDVLPKTGFNANSPPVEVYGGYLIRGDSKVENGDDLIDAIDASLAKSAVLRDKLTITYIKDLTGVMGVSDDEFEQAIMTNLPRALYVMGPNVAKKRNRLALTAVSALGIATSWYLSIYPFLLNPDFMKRAEEQVALADSSMGYDLTWLTDLSIPMFLTFMGLQVAHETGHRVVAGIYGLNVTLPTFVPSLASGITSSITYLKSPAKNREQLFDFAIAGPLTGIVGSLLVLYAGLQLTVNSDASAAAMFPALPLEILRQSSLGGGLIEAILGNGVLSIPEGAQGSQAIASINIPLHPVALAGYISLIVNALSLLPIGNTDGGRVSQAVLNRAGKQIVGQIALLALFAVGVFGDDLFLSYALFCSLFGQGSEIPQRNEVDDISFSRVLVATAAGFLVLLTVIPMQ